MIQFPLFRIQFFRPLLWGTLLHYIVLLFSSQPYTCWLSKHLLERLSHQPPLSLPLWVAEAKVVLFRGLFLINAAKRVVGTQLMSRWQLSMRYFGFYSFYMLGGWTGTVGQVLCLGFVTSEEELLLGQVSLALLGLSGVLYVVSPWTRRSLDGPEFGLAHYFWAGPHSKFFVLIFN